MRAKRKLTREQHALIDAIAERAVPLLDAVPGATFVNLSGALAKCHKYAEPIDFEALLKADDFNLVHDVHGIFVNLSVDGYLGFGFLPRFRDRSAR